MSPESSSVTSLDYAPGAAALLSRRGIAIRAPNIRQSEPNIEEESFLDLAA